MTMKRRGALAAFLMASACSVEPGAPLWCGADFERAVIHVADETAPRILQLKEVWRVGDAEGDAVFAQPSRASVSRNGRVAVPDMMTSAVVIVEADGTWRGSIVREGDGPGEVRWPVDVEWTGEHSLAVFDLAKGEVLRVSDTGQPLGDSWRIDPRLYGRIAASGSLPGGDLMSDGSLVLELPWEAMEGRPSDLVSTVVRLRPDGPTDTIQRQAVVVMNGGPFRDWPVPGAPRPLYAVGATGPLFRAGMDTHYRIVVLSRALEDSAVICRVVSPIGYTAAELGLLDEPAQLSTILREAPRPEVPASIGGLMAGENSRVWVLRNRSDPTSPQVPSEGGEYDVFSETGAFVGTVRAPERVYLVGEGGGQVYGFERGEYDEVTLVAYRLVEGA